MKDEDQRFLREAIEVAREGMERGDGGPFGCVIVKDGQVVARGCNRVTSDNDPTAHAEVVAIRAACSALAAFQLEGCTVYTSCEPCPMCLGALYWARPVRVVYGATREDAAAAGFDDQLIYEELPLPPDQRRLPMQHALREEANTVFTAWLAKQDRLRY
jgi:guanine deaminase